MENGSFHTRLAQMEFLEKSREEFSLSEVPHSTNHNPKKSLEKMTSSMALLRQNEDLSARLKMTMEKLIQLETQLDEEENQNRLLQKSSDSLKDQMLVWKEKERLWLEKLEKAELKNKELEERYPQFITLKNDLARYKKYHEKVKTQIKPYIQQLKNYSKGLLEQIKELNRENLNQKYELTQTQNRLQDMQMELTTRVTAHSLAIEELQRVHEREIESLQAELASTKESNIVLETKATRLNHALSRQDELENMCITLRRKLDLAEKKVELETEGLKSSLQLARNEVTKKTIQIESLESQNQNLQMAVNKMNLETTTLNEQLISLRYIWDEKSKQTEQMSAMIQSLEKMNIELSQKLNSMQK